MGKKGRGRALIFLVFSKRKKKTKEINFLANYLKGRESGFIGEGISLQTVGFLEGGVR